MHCAKIKSHSGCTFSSTFGLCEVSFITDQLRQQLCHAGAAKPVKCMPTLRRHDVIHIAIAVRLFVAIPSQPFYYGL